MAMNIRSVKNRLAELVSGVEEMVDAKQDLAEDEWVIAVIVVAAIAVHLF